MADTKISGLAADTTPAGTDMLPVETAGGTSQKVTLTQVQSFVQDLPANASPGTPAASTVRVFGRSVGGKMFPAFVGPSGLDSAMQASFARNKIAQYSPQPGATGLTATGQAIAAVGTATAKTPASTNLYTQTKGIEFLVTVAATTAVAGWRSSAAAYWRGNAAGFGGWFYVARFGVATGPSTATTTLRSFTGFGNNAAPTDVNPSSLLNMCGMGIDASDSNWQWMTNDGTGTATKTDLGANFVRNNTDRNKVFEVAMFCAPNGSEIFYEITDLGTGSVATGSSTTDLPVNTTFLAQKGYASVGGTSSVVGYMLSSLYIETDL